MPSPTRVTMAPGTFCSISLALWSILRPMMAPAAPPTTAPMMAPRVVEPVWLPITPPATPPAVAPMIAPLLVLFMDAQPDAPTITTARNVGRTARCRFVRMMSLPSCDLTPPRAA